MDAITGRWPNEGWGAFPVDSDVHVVPVEGDEAQQPAAGHVLDRGCWCQPKPVPVSDGPLGLDEGMVWSHREPTWKGANAEALN